MSNRIFGADMRFRGKKERVKPHTLHASRWNSYTTRPPQYTVLSEIQWLMATFEVATKMSRKTWEWYRWLNYKFRLFVACCMQAQLWHYSFSSSFPFWISLSDWLAPVPQTMRAALGKAAFFSTSGHFKKYWGLGKICVWRINACIVDYYVWQLKVWWQICATRDRVFSSDLPRGEHARMREARSENARSRGREHENYLTSRLACSRFAHSRLALRAFSLRASRILASRVLASRFASRAFSPRASCNLASRLAHSRLAPRAISLRASRNLASRLAHSRFTLQVR